MAKKVSFFVHDLGNNPIVRAAPFARAFIQMGWEVEILGFSYSYNRDRIYPPYKDEFEYKVFSIYNDIRWVILRSMRLARMAEGQVIYAFKPKWTTLWPALLASGFGMKKPLILDAEDNELWDSYIGSGWKALLKSPWYVENPVWNKLIHPLTVLMKRKTVVCRSLQKRYGGIIALHGPQNRIKHYATKNSNQVKLQYNLPLDKKITLFAGKATNYNGLSVLIKIFQSRRMQNWTLVLAGDKDQELFQLAKSELGSRCQLLGQVTATAMPDIIQIADAIPILQVKNKNTDMQVPAKFIEALQYGKPIIATDVCDIGFILRSLRNTQRLVVDSINDQEELLESFLYVEKEFNSKKYINDSIKYYNENASIEAICRKVGPLIN